MEKKDIDKFIHQKSKLITKILLQSHDSSDFETDSSNIEKNLYEVSLGYAKIYFFEEGSFLDTKNKDYLRLYVRARFNVKEKDIMKMSDEELLAHCIKVEVIDSLGDQNVLFF